MIELSNRFIGDDSPQLKSEQIFFYNLNLDASLLKQSLSPIIDTICARIEYTYKSPSKINYLGTHALSKITIQSCMQFDDLCIKLWHENSDADIFIILRARFARILLMRLLATSLIDDADSLPLSSAEKGIFSFAVSRLLFDLKNALNERMPNLKLVGIYHSQDDAIIDNRIDGFAISNFSLNFGSDIYSINIAIPSNFFKSFKKRKPQLADLSKRCGQLMRPMVFCLKTLNLSPQAFCSLNFGDLILFEHDDRKLIKKGLDGFLYSFWENISLHGSIFVVDNSYRFKLKNITTVEECSMENLEISYAKDKNLMSKDLSYRNSKLIDIAHNIRVALSIEVARIPMTLKELCQLKEGEIIDLQRKIEEPLAMVVENKVIGHCQPVQIDGRLGIRVIAIESDSNET